ncbi:MAG: TonB-dependent receptor domain-containing protein, partial [Bryobacteraceae bacterium]
VTKSGSNALHGSAYEFNRNRVYAARNGRAAIKPPLNRNDFGFTVGGPVRKDKTFFFGGYEGLRERSSVTRTLSVGTAAMRAGDFTGLPALIDPLSGLPFASNRIPEGRIDSRAKALIGFVPVNNQAGSGPAGTLNNFVVNVPNIWNVNRWIARGDHQISPRDSLTAGFTYSKGDPYFVARSTPPNYGNGGDFGYLTGTAHISYTRHFTARTLNEFRLAGLYHGSIRQGQNTDFNPKQLFPDLYDGLPYGGLPYAAINSHVAIGDYGGFDRSPQYTLQYIDNLSMVRGRHTIKAGFDFANYRNSTPPFAGGFGSGLLNEASFGRFNFNGRYTNADRPGAQPAHAYADFLLGYPVSTARSTATSLSLFYQSRYSAYVQDDWQVRPNLSVSLGLRYMVHTTWRERDDALSNFDFDTGRLVVPSDKLPSLGIDRVFRALPIDLKAGAQAYQSDRNNFAPRIGFAYRPFGNATTVFRGGFGLFYNPLPFFLGVRALNFSNPPFQISETFEAAAGPAPTLTLARPFGGSGSLVANPSITVMERNLKNGESYQWNLSLEREVAKNLGLRASYVGNHTAHLPYNGRQFNNPQTQAPGNIQPRRPYQPWSTIGLIASGGDSTLHQLQLEAVQRLARGLTFQIEYSWNRSLDNTPISGGPEDPYNNARDRGNSDQIRRHIFTAAYSYELPFGKGKRFAASAGALDRIVSGWQVAGITYLRTGPPFSVGFTATQAGALSGRPDAL